MNSTVNSTNVIKWQRISITALLMALLLTGSYSNHQIRRAKSEAEISRKRADMWQKEAVRSEALLQKERDVTEGLKSCMTFDQIYIREIAGKLARYEAAYGKVGVRSSEPRKKP